MEFEPYVRTWALGDTCEEVSMKDDCHYLNVMGIMGLIIHAIHSSSPPTSNETYTEGDLKAVTVKVAIV